jgi:hypothetical protein
MSGQSFLTSSSQAFRIRCRFCFPPAASSGDGSAWLELSFGGKFGESAEWAPSEKQTLRKIAGAAIMTIRRNLGLENGFFMCHRL